jgi:farnesyl diphosphate synthase
MNQLTVYGQCSDLLSNKPGSAQIDFSIYTRSRYTAIVTYKTAYYSFSLPARAALYLANRCEPQLHAQAERIMVKMGVFFQMQDDYLDVFADSKTLGKVGTDIADGKCSWPVITALELCTPEQKCRLLLNYGQADARCVAAVKRLFVQIGLPRIYEQLEENSFGEMMQMICKLTKTTPGLPISVFADYLQMVYKRQK